MKSRQWQSTFRNISPDKESAWGCQAPSKPCMQPGLGAAHVSSWKVKSAKGSRTHSGLKWLLWEGENGRKLKKLVPLTQRPWKEHRDRPARVRAALPPGWDPISGLTLARARTSIMDVLTLKRYPSVSSCIGHWRERIHITAFVKRQLLPNVSLNPFGFLTWSCCGTFSVNLGVRKMLLQFLG